MPGTATYTQASFQHALLQAISAYTPDFIAVLKQKDLSIAYINEPGARLFGYKLSKSLLNKSTPPKRVHPIYQTQLKKIRQTITKKGIFVDEVQYIDEKGKSFWGRLQVNGFTADAEKFYLVQIEKIDRAKFAEEKLVKEKKRFGALLDYASIAVIIVNRKQEIVLMNPYAVKLFGYKYTEIIGKKLGLLIPVKYRRQHQKHHEFYYQHPENRPMGTGRELTAVKKDGTEFPVEISLGTYKIEKEIYVIAYLSDITIRRQREKEIVKLNSDLEQKIKVRTEELADTIKKLEKQVNDTEAAEKELQRLLDREKELNQLKTRFVSTASHEFRTPLSTILSSAYLLQKYINTEDQPKRDKHIERITSSVNMLTDILNDFLSVGKIEEGKITTKFSQFNICENISEVINELKPVVKPGQSIICSCNGKKDVFLDPSMLKHIIMNLLSNAIKFSRDNATIIVDTKRKGQLLEISVTDNGIGISREDQQHLFERFFRGANAANIQGTGLGLHIVKKYAELMNGTVECRSELEKGTSFIVTFQLNNPVNN
ncbi:MAG: PAS domain S-box protein [Sphingobacteriales bacterium]|nr:PAS domain S-box protein [Sphingobacteriales bacterium]MBI3720455.1 PAS domain S-box protein [Sphingobacteriales bacterium]